MMSVRYIVLDDAEQVVKINIEGWQTAYRGIFPDEFLDSLDIKSRIRSVKTAISENPNKGFVFEDDKQNILGFCQFGELRWVEEFGEVCDCEMYAIYVLSRSRGQGVGKALMEAAFAEFRAQNKKSMLVNVLEENMPSVNFYKSLGGIEIGNKPFVLKGISYPQVTFGFKM